MRIILDTNVFISGVFFPQGPPRQILQGWKTGKLTLVVSPQILEEYSGTFNDLRNKYPAVDATDVMDLVLVNSEIYQSKSLVESVCEDADDDMFIACAMTVGVKIIISGDKHLLRVSGYEDIQVLKPRDFVERYLSE
jgi:putative PIN family toxin of toxin-antitoxin system